VTDHKQEDRSIAAVASPLRQAANLGTGPGDRETTDRPGPTVSGWVAVLAVWLLATAPAAASVSGGVAWNPLFLSQPDIEQENVDLSWSGLNSAFAFTVEVSSSQSAGNSWQAAPASVWPIRSLSWRDPLRTGQSPRFYRVAATSANADRGKFVSVTSFGLLDIAELKALFAQFGVPLSPATGVNLYKLNYETVNPFLVRTTGSGLLVVPQSFAKPLPLLSYQHGTIASRNEAPSSLGGRENVIGFAFGASGYVAALPDYVGLGDSPGLHPFLHAASEAAAGVDFLRAIKVFCASNSVALSGQLFLAGYSEGGHATMALHQAIETFHTNEFTVTASAPMAGPYDLSGVTANDFLSGRPMPNPYYFLYLLGAYQSIYRVADSFAEILASPYDRTLPPLLDGRHNAAEMNQAIGATPVMQLLRPEFLAAFRDQPNHPLRMALRENDVYDWTPKAPLHLYHCDGDQDVLFANSQVATNRFFQRGATQVELINPLPGASHGDCAPWALLAAKLLWFDTLVTP
jgi:hypothetical protein